MPDETVHINDADVPWEASYEGPGGPTVMIERTFFSAERTPTSGVSMGSFEVPPGAELPPHYHHPAETYYVTEGEAEVYHDGEWHPLRSGDALLFSSDAVHGVRNRGTERVAIVFVFPTDSYDAVEYIYVPEWAARLPSPPEPVGVVSDPTNKALEQTRRSTTQGRGVSARSSAAVR